MSSHNILKEFNEAMNNFIVDPGDAGAIKIGEGGICKLESTEAGGETRTLAAPPKAGIILGMIMTTDGGDIVVTVTGDVNQAGADEVTFDDVDDFILLFSVPNAAGTFEWRQIVINGASAA